MENPDAFRAGKDLVEFEWRQNHRNFYSSFSLKFYQENDMPLLTGWFPSQSGGDEIRESQTDAFSNPIPWQLTWVQWFELQAVFSIIAGVFVGGLGALAAGLGAASGLTFAYWAALFLTLIGGICQLIAGIKGVKHSKRSEKAGGLIVWGAIVAVFSVLSIVMNLVNGGEFNVTSVLTGVAVPALYIYGAVLNSKADAQYTA